MISKQRYRYKKMDVEPYVMREVGKENGKGKGDMGEEKEKEEKKLDVRDVRDVRDVVKDEKTGDNVKIEEV